MGDPIRALTVWQPWASLILAGAKPIEWRSYPFPVRMVGSRIAIHAGARPLRKREVAELLDDLAFDGEVGTSLVPSIAIPLLERWHTSPELVPLSTVLCTAILGAPIPAGRYAKSRGIDSDRIDHGKWGWPLTDIVPVIPMAPARGAQGFWKWTPHA